MLDMENTLMKSMILTEKLYQVDMFTQITTIMPMIKLRK